MKKTIAKKSAQNHEIAVTLYNLREYCKDETGLARTLEQLKRIGYRSVQISAVSLEPAVIRKCLDDYGMECCATHESVDLILNDTEKLIEKLSILKCGFTALGSAPAVYVSHDGMKMLGEKMSKAGEILAKHGIKLGYHNHSFEFNRYGQDKTLLQTLFDNSDPKYLYSELDVQWVARGGASPASWIRKLAGRIDVIHFKDFTIRAGQNGYWDATPTLCEIGYGNLDWEEIVKACRETKVRVFSIEQDSPYPGRAIFDSMRMSFEYCKKLGLKP